MKEMYDVIIVGGSYAGLSAAMALGRSVRKVLIVDSGDPCNRQTPHSHNFLTHDGETPAEISRKAREQVRKYTTVEFIEGKAVAGKKLDEGFQIDTESQNRYLAKKILFASGVKDILPEIAGFSDCWGISVLHCPYCHGYEVKNEPTAVIGNGDMGFEMAKLINHWTKNLTLFTNGASQLSPEQMQKITSHGIEIVETEIQQIEHKEGYVKLVHFNDGTHLPVTAVYARPALKQKCEIMSQLGCEFTEQGLLKVDAMQRTSVHGVYAAGDNTTMMRSVALSVAGGSFAGAAINKEMIEERF
jgi:thioredoxin reductase